MAKERASPDRSAGQARKGLQKKAGKDPSRLAVCRLVLGTFNYVCSSASGVALVRAGGGLFAPQKVTVGPLYHYLASVSPVYRNLSSSSVPHDSLDVDGGGTARLDGLRWLSWLVEVVLARCVSGCAEGRQKTKRGKAKHSFPIIIPSCAAACGSFSQWLEHLGEEGRDRRSMEAGLAPVSISLCCIVRLELRASALWGSPQREHEVHLPPCLPLQKTP